MKSYPVTGIIIDIKGGKGKGTIIMKDSKIRKQPTVFNLRALSRISTFSRHPLEKLIVLVHPARSTGNEDARNRHGIDSTPPAQSLASSRAEPVSFLRLTGSSRDASCTVCREGRGGEGKSGGTIREKEDGRKGTKEEQKKKKEKEKEEEKKTRRALKKEKSMHESRCNLIRGQVLLLLLPTTERRTTGLKLVVLELT